MTKINSSTLEKEAIGLNAADPQIISAFGVLRPASQSSRTKHRFQQCDRFRKRGEKAGIRVKLSQRGRKKRVMEEEFCCNFFMIPGGCHLLMLMMRELNQNITN